MEITYQNLGPMSDNKDRAKRQAQRIGIKNTIGSIEKMYDLALGVLPYKMKTGEKTSRTEIVRRAMGKDYPDSVIGISEAVDNVVGSWDELLDQNLGKPERLAYIATQVFRFGQLVGNDLKLNRKQRNIIGNYADKLMVLGSAEVSYNTLVSESKKEENVLKHAKSFYRAKSLVNDVFVELPLVELGYDMRKKESKDMVEVGRKNRSVGMIRKDIDDIQDDIKNNTRTPFTVLKQKGKKMRIHGRKLANEFLEELNEYKFIDKRLQRFKKNFYEMSKEEIKRI
ncbi:MAG: hypothetical protein JSV92_04445 [archaeon]|nr:MAG: hypothetical protein JSV92_04445 [archaeon]